jgi:hypothetical protein
MRSERGDTSIEIQACRISKSMGRCDVPCSGLIIPAIIATSGDNVKWLGKEFDRIMIHANDEVIRWCE